MQQMQMMKNNMTFLNFDQNFGQNNRYGNNFGQFQMMSPTTNFSPPHTPPEENEEHKNGFMTVASLLQQAANGLPVNTTAPVTTAQVSNGTSTSPFNFGDKMNMNPLEQLDALHQTQPNANLQNLNLLGEFSVPPLINPDKIYESSVRILYMSVSWARSIPTFLQLPFQDQALLLEESWSELFILSMIQCSLPMDIGILLSASGVQMQEKPGDKMVTSVNDLRTLQHIVGRFQALTIDSTEFACLKATVLFKPGW